MRKKREEPGKKTLKTSQLLKAAVAGAGAAWMGTMGLILLLAALILGGALPPDSPSVLLSACAGICAFAGARITIRLSEHPPMIAGLSTAALYGLTAALISAGGRGEAPIHAAFGSLLLMVLAGGGLAGLLGRPKKRKKKR